MNASCARAALHAHVAFAARMLDLDHMFNQALDNIENEEGGTAHVLVGWAWLVAYSSGIADQDDEWISLGLVDQDGVPFTPDDAPEWAWPQVQAARLITAAANEDRDTAHTLAHVTAADIRSRACLEAMADILTAPVKTRIRPPDDWN